MSVNAPLSASNYLAIGSDEALSVRGGLREKAAPWAVTLGALLVYLSFPTRNYYWDGINFALSIEHAQGLSRTLIHPHHLFYNVFGYSIYYSLNFLGCNVRAVHALQTTNAVLSALSAWLLFRVMRHVLRSTPLSSVLTFLFSFSATWWKYSTDADAYVPSVLLLLVCLNLMLTARKPRPWAIALAHAASMCLHQLAVLFYPVIVLSIFLQNPGISGRQRMMLILKYSAAASLLTLAANYYGFWLQTGAYGLAAFAGWLTSYLHGPHSYSFSFDLQTNLFYSLRGQTRLFFAGRLTWLKGLMNLPVAALLGSLMITVVFLTSRFIRTFKTMILRGRRARPLESRLKPVAAVCFLWACAYSIFLFFWYPYFTPYRVFYLPSLILLLGIVLTHYEIPRSPTRLRYAALFVAAVAGSNFLFFIYPLSYAEKNPPLAMAVEMNKTWSHETVIFYAAASADGELFKYFNPTTDWRRFGSLRDESFEDELREIYRRGGAAWIDTSALDQLRSSPEGFRWLAEHTSKGRRYELINESYRIEFTQIFPSASNAGTSAPGELPEAPHANEDSFK